MPAGQLCTFDPRERAREQIVHPPMKRYPLGASGVCVVRNSRRARAHSLCQCDVRHLTSVI